MFYRVKSRLLRVLIAGIISIFLLNIICSVYYTVPVTEPSETGVTDFVNEKNFRYSIAIEGFGYGKTNNEGMNNIKDFCNQKIDILLMGSSHMEARQVPQNKTTAAVLNDLFGGSNYVYNMGMGGHDFPHLTNNFGKAVRYYKPEKFVVMETASVDFDENTLRDLIDGKLKTSFPDSNVTGIKSALRNSVFLRKMSFFRLLNYKISLNAGRRNAAFFVSDNNIVDNNIYDNNNGGGNEEKDYFYLLNTIMERLHQICLDNNISLIIFYHLYRSSNNTGEVMSVNNKENLEKFKRSCEENGIKFVDMTDVFSEKYKQDYILPYGFFNTAAGKGHLNSNGHRLIAEELYKQINSF
jgi:hypothetical protein